MSALFLTLLSLALSAPYAAPHRAPDELWASDLPDSAKIVWSVVRGVQGGRAGDDVPPAYGQMGYYGSLCNKSENAVTKWVGVLKDWGWLEEVGKRARTPMLRCHVGPLTEPRKPAPEAGTNLPAGQEPEGETCPSGRNDLPAGQDQSSSQADSPTPPDKDESSQGILPGNPKAAADLETSSEGEPAATSASAAAFLDQDGGGKTGDPADPRNLAFAALRKRGLDEPAAKRLAGRHVGRVLPLVERLNAEFRMARQLDNPLPGPGWLVRAVEEGWDPDQRPAPPPGLQADRHQGRSAEAERNMARIQQMRREDEAGVERGDVGDWKAQMEEERRKERARLEALQAERRPVRRSARDLPTEPVAEPETTEAEA